MCRIQRIIIHKLNKSPSKGNKYSSYSYKESLPREKTWTYANKNQFHTSSSLPSLFHMMLQLSSPIRNIPPPPPPFEYNLVNIRLTLSNLYILRLCLRSCLCLPYSLNKRKQWYFTVTVISNDINLLYFSFHHYRK